MRPYESIEGEQSIQPARRGGLTSSYSLAFVCVLSLLAGGIAALALHYARQDRAEVQEDVARRSADAGRAVGIDSGAEGGRVPEVTLAADVEASGVGGEAGETAEEGVGAPAVRFRKTREAGQEIGRAERRSSAARGYVRVSRRGGAGGRGVAGHAVGGVKKTGKVIGKAFGKIGGVFHD